MEVTSTRSVEFPKLGWAISAGETKALPESKDAQKIILANPHISPVEKKGGTVKN